MPTPLQDRDRLLQELASTHTEGEKARAFGGELEHRRALVTRDHAAALQAAARGDNKSHRRAAEIDSELRDIRDGIEAAQAKVNAAHAARTAVEQEIERLYTDHLPAFAAEAELKTQEAHERLLALEEPYRAALAAWAAAARAWQPLAGAVRTHIDLTQDEHGLWRNRTANTQSAQPPPCPLPAIGNFTALPAARPPAMRRAD